jgi:hypothetical protein
MTPGRGDQVIGQERLNAASNIIGASKSKLVCKRASLALVLLFLLVQAKPASWAQGKEWDKH